MADSNYTFIDATGNTQTHDARTESTNSEKRAVINIGDPAVNNSVALVKGADPASNDEGLVVRDVNTSAIAAALGGSVSVYLNGTGGTLGVRVGQVDGSVAVYFSPSGPTIGGIANSINVYLGATAGTIRVGDIPGSMAVYFSPSSPAVNATFSSASLEVIPSTGSRIMYDQGYQAQRVLIAGSQLSASLQVSGITNSINVYLGATAGTIRVGDIPGSMAVYFSPSGPVISGITNSINAYIGSTGGTIWVKQDADGTLGAIRGALPTGSNTIGNIYNLSSTAQAYYQASGSYAGVSASGKTLASPAASSNIKVFAIALTTTAQVGTVVQLTNGAGTSPTEFWRYALQAPAQGIAGANLAVAPPGYLFATGSNVTLAILTNNASLIHYSLSYFRESA